MPLLNIDMSDQRSEHPLDIVERIASLRDWMFDRHDHDEISVAVSGIWTGYRASFSWMETMETLHVSCAFNLKLYAPRQSELLQLISLINQQLWVGHFDLWNSEHLVLFRHSLVLSDGAEPTPSQCEMLLEAAVEACENYYQAFQFVLWSGQSAQDALQYSLFMTEGNA